MSKLKRHHINEVMDMHNLTRGKMGYSFVYYVDDVDRVIARHKYKRCLAMARWCRGRACFYDTMRADSLFWAWKSDRAYKWHKHWLKLADKFKEVK